MTKNPHELVDDMKEEMIDFAREILSVPAMAPESGGDGEEEKVKRIRESISGWGFDSVKQYNAPDERVPSGERPNLLVTVKGLDPKLPPIWVFVHTDVVPPGDRGKWSGDPWSLRIDGDKMTARGVEDNGQDLVSALFAAKAVIDSGKKPRRDINIFLVADEEVGSAKGMHYLVEEHGDLFSEEALYIVPDAGSEDGSMIEVAEKSILWLKIETIGKSSHASDPHKGNNANEAAMRMITDLLDDLRGEFSKEDPLFDPPYSTFVPTKREANVPNVNSIPGEDVSYIDCRVLPDYDPDRVLELIEKKGKEAEKRFGVKVNISIPQYEKAAPPTSPDHPIVGMLKKAVKEVYDVEAEPMGIGGGTCAAILRSAGCPSAVWARLADSAHMPDEFAHLSSYIGDAKVFSLVFMM